MIAGPTFTALQPEIVPDRAARLDSIVTMGSWVTFWITWGFPRETKQLVYPEDYTSERTQIPVTSPLGAALGGLKVGSEIPFFTAGRSAILPKIASGAELKTANALTQTTAWLTVAFGAAGGDPWDRKW